MKIGIISDIHGYIEPLKLAIALFESLSVSQIICAGDLVDGGWDGEAVIDCIRANNIICVRGNHDRESFQEQVNQDYLAEYDDEFYDQINAYRANYVRSLPMICSFNWANKQIRLTHATPWNDTFHIFPNTSADICQKLFDTSPADIMILGHTHIPMKIQFKNRWIFNSGALCGNRHNLQRTCATLDLPQADFKLYDVDTGQAVNLEMTVKDLLN